MIADCGMLHNTILFQEVANTSVKSSGFILKNTYLGILSQFVKGLITERGYIAASFINSVWLCWASTSLWSSFTFLYKENYMQIKYAVPY